jgi:hypothetical protein
LDAPQRRRLIANYSDKPPASPMENLDDRDRVAGSG